MISSPLIFIIIITLLVFTTATSNRRLLHQPFFSNSVDQPIYLQPSSSPSPEPLPKYHPFSTLYYPPPPQNPFFPSYPSPPTIPIINTNTVPVSANISSLVIPSSSTSHSSHNKTISLISSLSFFSFLILASIIYLLIRRTNNTTNTNNNNNTNTSIKITPFTRLGSPELHPLPTLPRHQFLTNDEDFKFSSIATPSQTHTHTHTQTQTQIQTYFDNSSSSSSCSPSVVLNLGSQRTTEFSSPDYFPTPFNVTPIVPQRQFSTFSPSSNEECVSDFQPLAKFWESGEGPPELVGPTKKKGSFGNSGEIGKPMFKPFLHWDKIRVPSHTNTTMVWDHLKSGTFELNEEMIKTLFTVNSSTKNEKDCLTGKFIPDVNKEKEELDPKNSHNIDILLKALNVTIEEVCEAIAEGNGDTLGTELLESLLKMAPTKQEEWKLKEFKDDSTFKLGTAETFLKALVDIPFAFQRVEAMLYIANFDSEIEYLKKCFSTLESACKELRSSRMFLKLLEAVLRTGNSMNVGTNSGKTHACKLDTLLKLVNIKSTDGKTTLLHFVVQEIIKTEGAHLSGIDQNLVADENQQSTLQYEIDFRKLGLQVVSGLSGELTNVKKAATMQRDLISDEVLKLAKGLTKISEVIKLNEELSVKDKNVKFANLMIQFLNKAKGEIVNIQEQESIALSMVKALTEYFHGDLDKEEARPFRLFVVMRDFLCILDQVCKDVGKINERTMVSSRTQYQISANPVVCGVFPGLSERLQDIH